jgi:hypothetical protein
MMFIDIRAVKSATANWVDFQSSAVALNPPALAGASFSTFFDRFTKQTTY